MIQGRGKKIAICVILGFFQEALAAGGSLCPKLEGSDALNFFNKAAVQSFENNTVTFNTADLTFAGMPYALISKDFAKPNPASKVFGGGVPPKTDPTSFFSYGRKYTTPYCLYTVNSGGSAPQKLTFYLYLPPSGYEQNRG